MQDVGRSLLVFGVLLAVIGGGLMLFGRFHLPGDFTFSKRRRDLLHSDRHQHHPVHRADRGPERDLSAALGSAHSRTMLRPAMRGGTATPERGRVGDYG